MEKSIKQTHSTVFCLQQKGNQFIVKESIRKQRSSWETPHGWACLCTRPPCTSYQVPRKLRNPQPNNYHSPRIPPQHSCSAPQVHHCSRWLGFRMASGGQHQSVISVGRPGLDHSAATAHTAHHLAHGKVAMWALNHSAKGKKAWQSGVSELVQRMD